MKLWLVWLGLLLPGLVLAGKPKPWVHSDEVRGFALTLPGDWIRVEQDTGQGEREPVFKAVKDSRSQFLAVLVEKGPTDDAEIARVAEANVEKGFSAAKGYKRTSIKTVKLARKPGGKSTVLAVDLWFTMERGTQRVTLGVRAIFLPGQVLTLIVDGGGAKADATTRRLLESFHPIESKGAAQPFTSREVVKGVWVITALRARDGYPANAVIFDGDDGALLVDSLWTAEQARAMVAWWPGHPIKMAVVTHFHDDRTGGIGGLAGIPVYGTQDTIDRAKKQGNPVPDHVLGKDFKLPAGVAWQFPGQAHAPDNIVLWQPASQVLVGGCLVKAGDAPDLGNLADASVPAWNAVMKQLSTSYGKAKVVVPGHGAPGGPELLKHTLDLTTAR